MYETHLPSVPNDPVVGLTLTPSFKNDMEWSGNLVRNDTLAAHRRQSRENAKNIEMELQSNRKGSSKSTSEILISFSSLLLDTDSSCTLQRPNVSYS